MDPQTYTDRLWAPEQDWRTEIAAGIPNRSKQLYSSENVMTKNASTHGNDSMGLKKVRIRNLWTPTEDKILLDLTTNHGTTNWTLISEKIPNRSGKQCRERFHNHLCGDIEKGAWTDEEDKLLINLQKQYGNQWAKITKNLPGRTENAVKNHWWTAIRRYNRMNTVQTSLASNVSTFDINLQDKTSTLVKRIVTEVGSDHEDNDEDRSIKTQRVEDELRGPIKVEGALKESKEHFMSSNNNDVDIGDNNVDVCNEHSRTSTLVSESDDRSKATRVENEDKCNAVDSNNDSGQGIDDHSDASLEELDDEDFTTISQMGPTR